MAQKVTSKQLALEIDLRLNDLWRIWEDETFDMADRDTICAFFRYAYGLGYKHALKDKGQLLRDTGYPLEDWME